MYDKNKILIIRQNHKVHNMVQKLVFIVISNHYIKSIFKSIFIISILIILNYYTY